jgi:hypothetical protein
MTRKATFPEENYEEKNETNIYYLVAWSFRRGFHTTGRRLSVKVFGFQSTHFFSENHELPN